MKRPTHGFDWLRLGGVLALALALMPLARAQQRPYIGFAYPAGGQVGTTIQLRLGGQGLDDVDGVIVSGPGVTARLVEYRRRLGNQEITLLNDQLKELKKPAAPAAPATGAKATAAADNAMTMSSMVGAPPAPAAVGLDTSTKKLIERIEERTREWVQTPACASISSLALVEVTIAPDAEPGEREIRLSTLRGVSNPLVFEIGQLPEYARKPMITASLQILGKEAQALRKRPPAEVEDRVVLPCTVNGQIASGEVNRYRFSAHKGQQLVISTQARQLIPFIADAVPGWFQPVLTLYDARGKEVAFEDDYRFKPDPVICLEVPQDGEYVVAIADSIFRGREDFVYRISLGELPFVTSVFPLGGRAGVAAPVHLEGWNLPHEEQPATEPDAPSGLYSVVIHRDGIASNRAPFVLDDLPEAFEREPNNNAATAQPVTLPVIINGRIDEPNDWDVYRFIGKANQTIVAEVMARRLDSPLDSVIKLTDAQGNVIAFNDDREDLANGLNTHQADSYLTTKLPAEGTYYLHIGDTAQKGGPEYAYRLRLSEPRPDFELRAVPSSAALRINASTTITVYALRKDGYAGPIKLALQNPPAGFSAQPVVMPGKQTVARLNVKGPAAPTKEPVNLSIVGSAKIGDQELVRAVVPAEDRMQAFLWRHLVPAAELKVVVFDPNYTPPPKRVPRPRSALVVPVVAMAAPAAESMAGAPSTPIAATTAPAPTAPATSSPAPTTTAAPSGAPVGATMANAVTPPKPKFSKQQVTQRLQQLKNLYAEGLLTDDFYDERVAECDATP